MIREIKVLKNCNSHNYFDSPQRTIKNIIVGMTNIDRSGWGYANLYKSPLKPMVSYNYIIDKDGNVYKTFDDSLCPYVVKHDDQNFYNIHSIGVCIMPVREEECSCLDYEDIGEGVSFPENPEEGEYFNLIKTVGTHKKGIYRYEDDGDGEWIYVGSPTEKRTYHSDGWAFTDASLEAAQHFLKWLYTTHGLQAADIIRVYDVYKDFNPAPFLYNDGEWETFRDEIHYLEDYDDFFEVEEKIPREDPLTPPDKSTEELEQIMLGHPVVADNSFKGESVIDLASVQGNQFSFEMSIRDTNNTSASQATSTILYRITSVVKNISWVTNIGGQVGELSFTFENKDNTIPLKEGFNVGFIVNGIPMFNGNIFEIRQQGNNPTMLDVKAYDSTRFLSNCGIKVFENKTASQIFADVCQTAAAQHRIINNSVSIVPKKVCFNESYYDMIDKAIAESNVAEHTMYIIQDNFGIIEFRNILDPINVKTIKFSKNSAVMDWDFSTNINESYNIIVAYTPGEGSSDDSLPVVADVASVKDSTTEQAWGRLQKIIQVDSKSLKGSLQNLATQFLKFYNSPRRTLALHCLGIAGIMAGNIIFIEIENVVSAGTLRGCVIVDKCTHSISNGKHVMDLECEIVQDGVLQSVIEKLDIGELKEIGVVK